MALTLGNVAIIVTLYEKEISECSMTQQLGSVQTNPFLEKLTLQKIQQDLPRLLRAVNEHRSSKLYQLLKSKIQDLLDHLDECLYEVDSATSEFLKRYEKETIQASDSDALTTSEPEVDETKGENYASLRKRLLADGKTSLLDAENSSSEKMNDYHETIQEDLLGELGTLASALKSSARSLSAKIVDDANLVSETGENMMKNLTLMQSVGTNLNAYLSEKTGGKITIFFMIKTMAFVFVLFFIMVVLTKILPKM
ncbi:unconventional SNARE protein 1 [Metschnikowia aff. pulcherrima]|uniref:Unconventional SNARE protein 1 n=1 Tax=Metschnikowia aff. pulcherrima TaxID=2163413 RepID=A0A4P6XIQ6_9ASCO|nr:unconventional SNARE protein 1 [Metschnikowia aff. pulcherrima]